MSSIVKEQSTSVLVTVSSHQKSPLTTPYENIAGETTLPSTPPTLLQLSSSVMFLKPTIRIHILGQLVVCDNPRTTLEDPRCLQSGRIDMVIGESKDAQVCSMTPSEMKSQSSVILPPLSDATSEGCCFTGKTFSLNHTRQSEDKLTMQVMEWVSLALLS